jgi:hypothetical protein
MAGFSGGAGGGGGLSVSSPAQSQSGSIKTGGQNFGGITVPSKGFELNTKTLLIFGGVVFGYIVLKKTKIL